MNDMLLPGIRGFTAAEMVNNPSRLERSIPDQTLDRGGSDPATRNSLPLDSGSSLL